MLNPVLLCSAVLKRPTSAAMKAKIVTPICRPAKTQIVRSPQQDRMITYNKDSNFTWMILGVVGENDT